jgi:hypothetical protein
MLLLGGVGFYLTPYLAVYNMKKAAEQRGADALSSYRTIFLAPDIIRGCIAGKPTWHSTDELPARFCSDPALCSWNKFQSHLVRGIVDLCDPVVHRYRAGFKLFRLTGQARWGA